VNLKINHQKEDTMKKSKSKFLLAEANIDETNKQLKINMFVIAVVIFLLGINTIHFFREKSLFYAALVALMIFLLFFIIKSRKLLKLRKQELTNQI